MSFPAYPSYQHSGVAWLGRVPSHWEVTRLKRACSIFASNVDKKSVDGQQAIRLCNYTDVYYNDLIEATLPFMEATATSEQIDRFSLLAGDTIITKDSESPDDIARSAYVPMTLPGVICGYHLSMIRPSATAHGPFIKRYFDSAHARAYFHTNANGLTRVGLGQYALDNAPIALPPQSEQIAIAAFLDRETAKIDALIDEQRRLIALLKEKRQAVISHAVTKGLDPNAPMKDSGIEWLGEVPAHWEVSKLGFHAKLQSGYAFSSTDFGTDGVPIVRMNNLARGKIDLSGAVCVPEAATNERVSLNEGDLIWGMSGSIGETGSLGNFARVSKNDLPSQLNQRVGRFIPMGRITLDYLEFVIQGHAFQQQTILFVTGTAQFNVSGEQVQSISVAIPPAVDQAKICSFLKETLGRYDLLVAEAKRSIDLLNERRAALISAAVTGKIDVRGTAQVLPFPIDRARARGLIAAEIIERSAHQSTFGRVKFQKIAFLTEAHVGVSELAGSYTREAAGPLDRALIEEMESGARSIAGIEHEQPGGAGTIVSYRLGQQRGAHRQELEQWLGKDRTAKLDKLIGDFAALSTKEAEAVATLYGVWNDALCEGASPTDEEIISGFLNDWHPEKRAKFRASELPEWLGWMRRHGIVPTGSGPETTTGRLFV
ncbi:restriction endonuclease subunit S [Sphingobium yanoikuyae]|uniref:restriction endonuclease subunit S n=1 Tax=Sphingobium yanoikuyae TaxID=13690 RepID=UPI0022DE4615|nr:restriction endonuclease subunit S [Sphingobium yanoikuyae]WBQ15993.1 restriction endonuclease subunit S [Sphingobium yanoikuyae]